MRKEWLIKWFATCLVAGDVDPSIWAINYLNERYEHNLEERYWLAWLYHTYQLPQSWVLKQEFPDQELATYERMKLWNDQNYKKLCYQNDTKWSKGHLPEMYLSYHEWLEGKSQHERISEICCSDPETNFNRLWEIVKKDWFKFGRYTTFFYLQTLKHTCSVPIDCPTLFLSDYSGSKSHRNGLCYAANKEDWIDAKLTAQEYQWLEGFGKDVLEESKKRYPHLAKDMDNFALETVLCSAKKLWRVRQGRYLGYYLDRQSEDIMKVESKNWPGIDWGPLWDARSEVVGEDLAPKGAKVDKTKMALFLEEGRFHREIT